MEAEPPLIVAASPQPERPCLLAGTPTGLLRSEDEGQNWQSVLEIEDIITVLFSPRFAEDGRVWVGASAGELLVSDDSGLTWRSLPSPRDGQALVTLAVSPASSQTGAGRQSGILAAASFNPG